MICCGDSVVESLSFLLINVSFECMYNIKSKSKLLYYSLVGGLGFFFLKNSSSSM